jgi:hypothetical protein
MASDTSLALIAVADPFGTGNAAVVLWRRGSAVPFKKQEA